MLDTLTQRLSSVIKNIRGQARFSENNIQDVLREVRLALLEADVALFVVKEFTAQVKQLALGQEVLQSLTPGQALIGIVHKELTRLMGEHHSTLNLATVPPAVILMTGLQGAGKTTTSGKLAKLLHEKEKKRVLLVSCDIYRPAAIEQLQTLAQQLKIDFFVSNNNQNPCDIALAALAYARTHHHDVLIVDTAGRLAINTAMMEEIQQLHEALDPVETIFVVDAMAGQDAATTAKAFSEALPLTGIILTKLDGDARGGAALSVRHLTGKPIKFIGLSEKLNGLEAFHPERMASRILGMGDVLSLIEDVQRGINQTEAEKLARKVKLGQAFDLNDFKIQLSQMRQMGGMSALLDKLPSQLSQNVTSTQMDDRIIHRNEGIINSMTSQERSNPELIKASRKRRIATGAGVQVMHVNQLLNQFEQTQKMMKMFTKGGAGKIMRSIKGVLPGRR